MPANQIHTGFPNSIGKIDFQPDALLTVLFELLPDGACLRFGNA